MVRTRMDTLFAAVVWAVLSPLVVAAGGETKSVYDPQQFTLSYWCGPPADFLSLERFQEVQAANFTLAFPPCGGLTVKQNRAMLDLCQQVGLRAFISDSRMANAIGGDEENRRLLDAIIKDYSDHPALLGYHIVDEPGPAAFDDLAATVAYLKDKDPQHPGFINLLPNYASAARLGDSYEQYVRTFAEKVKPFVISYDHYHFTNAGDRAGFLENLRTVRKVSLDAGIPFWNIVLLTQHFDYRRLTEAELRFEAMQSLAYGAKGLLWFTYWMPPGVPEAESWKHSLINADGSRDPHYEMIQRINAETKAIGDVLVKAKSISVFQCGGNEETAEPKSSPIILTGGKLTVGIFHETTGGEPAKTLALATNRDYKNAAQTTLSLRSSDARIEVFDPANKTWSPASKVEHGVTLKLPAGGGTLLRW